MHEQKQIYSLRKLSVGLASVIVGTCFFISNGQQVKADTVNAGEQPTTTVIQQYSSKKQEQDSNKQNDQLNVSNSKNEQQQSTPFAKDVENVESNLNDTNKLDNATKPDTSIDTNVTSSVTKNIRKIQTNTLKVVKESTVNPNSLKESKAVNPNNNGGFDEATWGTLDVNNWKGSVQGDYYQLNDYTGDGNHVIVPNEADFEKAGISTSGKQVGVTSSLMHTIFKDKATPTDATVAFSKTDDKMVKAIDSNWSDTWRSKYMGAILSKFDGTNLDVSNVTDMTDMFQSNQISDLNSLANWNVSNVTNMNRMLDGNQISDLSPLAKWDVSHVTDMEDMFSNNQISDLSPLANWNVNNVTDMAYMFQSNQISNLNPLAKWDVSHVTDMEAMFGNNQISDLSPLANWNVNNVTNMGDMFSENQISDLSPLANWNVNNVTNMSDMFTINQISDLNPLSNWEVDHVTDMTNMFAINQISDLSPLSNWNVNNVTNMRIMFWNNQISDLSPLSNWHTDNVTDMNSMFANNQIGDISPLSNWNVNNVTTMFAMFDDNSSTQTKTTPANRVINFVYPAGYTGKKQGPVTQTIDVPTKQVKVELTTKESKPSNNILDWVTKTETPISEPIDPVYFQDYRVPTVSKLVPSISTVAKAQADPNMPLNVVVTYTATPVIVHFSDVDDNADKDSDAVKQELDKTVQLSGTYGSNVDLSTVKLPANFELANDLPSVQYGKKDSVTINLKHHINDVKAENAEDATRTIVINKYDGHGNLASTQIVVQQIAFYKHDYVDAVTGKTKSSKYIFDDKSSPALSHNLVDGKTTNDPSYTLKDGKYYFAKYKLDVPAGYKAKEKKLTSNMMMISLFALPAISTGPDTSQTVDPNANKGQSDTTKKQDTSSPSVIDKANNSHDLHDDSKKQNDQPITSNKENDHTINVSAQAVDPTVEPEKNNVASQNNSTTSAQTQQSSTNDAEQPENIPADRVVNDQTDDDNFDDSSREYNDGQGSKSASNWSKPVSGKIIHVDAKNVQKGLNEASKAQSIVSQPSNSVIKNSETSAKQLPQTGESDGFNYSVLGVLLGLNVAIAAVGAEKKRKKY